MNDVPEQSPMQSPIYRIWIALAVLLLLIPWRTGLAETLKPDGVYRVEKIDGVWWFLRPDGEREVSIGINHVEPILWLGSHNRDATLKRYGNDFVVPPGQELPYPGASPFSKMYGDFNPTGSGAKRWMSQVLVDLDDWGFNALGYHTDAPRPLFRKSIAYVQAISTAKIQSYARKRILSLTTWPDVFSSEFETAVDAVVRPIALDCRNDANLIGYAFSDTPRWALPRDGNTPQWVGYLRTLKENSPGKQAWVRVLKEHYSSAESAALSYGLSSIKEWKLLAETTQWPEKSDSEQRKKDCLEMMRRIASRWFQVHIASIRAVDPDHMILGDKFNCNRAMPKYLWPIIKEYIDVILVQWYSRSFDSQRNHLLELHEATGKPILLGDSSFAVVHPRQTLGSKGIKLESQDAVGRAYTHFLKTAMSEPHIIGWHYCGYLEGWSGFDSTLTGPSKQNGFKDPFENIYEDAVRHVRAANHKAWSWHNASGGLATEN